MSETTPAIQAVPIADLRAEYIRQNKIKIAAIQSSNYILAELHRRYANNLADLLLGKGKQHGEVTEQVDGVKLRLAVKQTVSYDTEKLKAAYGSVPADIAEKVFKLAISVPEKIYNALTDKKLFEQITEARTTKTSDPQVEFVIEADELK